MRNDDLTTKRILSLTAALPFFNLADLAPFGEDKSYLKIILSRFAKKGVMIRLKKSMYVAKAYLDAAGKGGLLSDYLEFIANNLYPSSYISLDYILYEHNILTETPKNFTSISLLKTARFSNAFGNFFYHTIKKGLFLGFNVIKKGNFTVLKATRAKALFDFIYLRKNNLLSRKAIEELRLNLEHLTPEDWQELEGYVGKEGSRRMKEILITCSDGYGNHKTNTP